MTTLGIFLLGFAAGAALVGLAATLELAHR